MTKKIVFVFLLVSCLARAGTVRAGPDGELPPELTDHERTYDLQPQTA